VLTSHHLTSKAMKSAQVYKIALLIFLILSFQRSIALEADPEIDSLTKLLPASPDSVKARLYNEIASVWIYNSADSSRYYARLALRLARLTSYAKEEANALQNLGISFRDQGSYDSALHYLSGSKALWTKIGSRSSLAAVNNDLGIVYDEKAHNSKAIELYLEAVKIYEETNDLRGQAKVYNNLGIIYKKEEQFAKSLQYYQKALEMYEALNSSLGVTISNGNIGSVQVEIGNYEESIQFSKEAIEGYEKLSLSRYVPYSMTNIGMAYQRMGLLEEAESWYSQSVELYREYGNKKEEAFSLNGLSEVYYASQQYSKALSMAEKSYEMALESGAADEIRQSSKSRALALEALKRFPEALQFWKTHIVVSDSLLRKERTRAIAELQTLYETEKKEQEISLLRAEASIKDLEVQQARQANWLMLLSVVVALALAGSGFIRFRYKQRVKEAEEKKRSQQDRFRAVIETEEKERKRIAQELHDGVGQVLTAARLNLSLLEGKVGDKQDKPLLNSVKLLNDAISEIRGISHNMMPRALAGGGFSDAVKDTVEKINSAGKVKIGLYGDWENDLGFTEEKAIALYRIIQELLNNSLKYSGATDIKLTLERFGDGAISLSIADNGSGFDTSSISRSTGIGWKSIFSRVEMINGQIEVQSKPSSGTEIQLRLAS